MSLIVVGWLYIPFSKQFIGLLKLTPLGSLITDIPLPGPERLVGNYVYVILTGQVLNLFQETIIPYLSRKITGAAMGAISKEKDEEKKDEDEIAKQIEKEMELPIYDGEFKKIFFFIFIFILLFYYLFIYFNYQREKQFFFIFGIYIYLFICL